MILEIKGPALDEVVALTAAELTGDPGPGTVVG